MDKEFIPYEQALALKELGFHEPCFGRYIYDGRGKVWFLVQTQQTKNASVIFEGDINVDGISIASPLYQQAFRWFREKYNLHYRITYYDPIKAQKLNHADYQGGIYDSAASWFDGSLYIPHTNWWKLENSPYDTYKDAELECLKKLIEIVKSKL